VAWRLLLASGRRQVATSNGAWLFTDPITEIGVHGADIQAALPEKIRADFVSDHQPAARQTPAPEFEARSEAFQIDVAH